MTNRFFTPVLVGGIVIGVLSALPLVAWGNAFCCLWILLGGATAAYLLQVREPGPLSAADGALVGALAGAAGALVYLVLSIPITLITTPIQQMLMQRLQDGGARIPPELTAAMSGAAGVSLRLLGGFVLMLFLSPTFGAVGGLLGAMAFRKPPPPATAPPASPGERPATG